MRGSVRAETQRSFSRTKVLPNETLIVGDFVSHSSFEFKISTTGRLTNRARSASTHRPHGLGPVASERSTPTDTRWVLKSDWVNSTAAANGCSLRSAAARITLMKLGQST